MIRHSISFTPFCEIIRNNYDKFISIFCYGTRTNYDLDKTRTTPYRSQSDGFVERFNGTLQIMLSSFVNENRNDWNDHLPYLLMAYRAIEHISTGSHHIK
jgi:hypothetical protein